MDKKDKIIAELKQEIIQLREEIRWLKEERAPVATMACAGVNEPGRLSLPARNKAEYSGDS